MYQIEDLRTVQFDEAHITPLKFYHEASLDQEAIMSEIVSYETGMVVSCLMSIVTDEEGSLKVHVHWKGMPNSEDILEPLQRLHENVPMILLKMLNRQSTPSHLAPRVRRELSL